MLNRKFFLNASFKMNLSKLTVKKTKEIENHKNYQTCLKSVDLKDKKSHYDNAVNYSMNTSCTSKKVKINNNLINNANISKKKTIKLGSLNGTIIEDRKVNLLLSDFVKGELISTLQTTKQNNKPKTIEIDRSKFIRSIDAIFKSAKT